jgi:hypothetical protein
MLGAQLRSELAKPALEVDKIRSLCKRNPIGEWTSQGADGRMHDGNEGSRTLVHKEVNK